MYNSNILLLIIDDINDIWVLTNKGTSYVNVVYILKGYEIALQYTNDNTWTDRVILAIKDLTYKG